MRVLMILFKDIHYDARVQREALALARSGWDVDIACLHTTAEPPPDLHEKIRLLRIPIHTKRMKRYVERKADRRIQRGVYRVIRNPVVKMAKDVVAQRQFALKISELCQAASYDAVHCHDLNTLSIGVSLKRKKGYTLIYDSHELFNEMNGKGRWERMVGYRVEAWWIHYVDWLITVNELMEREFKNRYGRELKTAVVRNIPESLEQLPVEKNYFHQKYQLDEEDRILLYQGGFSHNRGLEEVIRSLVHLPVTCKLVLLGFGELQERLTRMAEELKLTERVFFHEPLLPQEMLRVTAHADVGMVLYQDSCLNNVLSTPNKIFEYIQAGIPMVSSDHPGKAIVVGATKTGKLVDPQDVKGIADAIREILEEPESYLIAALKAKRKLTWEKEQEQLVQLYETIESTRERDRENHVSIQPHLREL
ncbi:glycosyltransferase [Desmospora profundinema]|uniref:Glycosyltransferase involved in cell wall biosynthesis n=1 Tax=Desmospora profundinema TaxID=1571184 RepID=A0ABU1IRH3_9BACL|nr:glycosyltransferase [Desmospora profundinema]MDR6227028.1 glycosyltransferase involved in cell wall biosynthesis [Desmospora profundinema]